MCDSLTAAFGNVVSMLCRRKCEYQPRACVEASKSLDVCTQKQERHQSAALQSTDRDYVARTAEGQERVRVSKAWDTYTKFVKEPGHKCSDCWLMRKHCCCAGLPIGVTLRPKVAVVFHHLELGKHLGSNTAKLLLHFGAELFAWGVEEHDERLRQLLREDPEGTVVLFPSPTAVTAADLARAGDLPRCIVVLDGGWRECKKMNDGIDESIRRCVVTTAKREEYGGTRKYGGSAEEAAGRVQTAAAFACMLEELGEDPGHVDAVKAGLAHFMDCWEAQICRSKTWVS
eukprot:TRINITY_DN7465_c0_g1_i1.p1 TRINITY_DN7465_c0_g1~~TRINITY_DN7465_c0_g1_i1.p1  ORF type:complete len:287 (+),score=48.74 TRINITY_DN7465_c0_g1_i1:86-946(+)